MCHDVVVSGLGVVASNGVGCGAFAASLRSGKSGITYNDTDGLGVAGRLDAFDFQSELDRLSLSEAVATRAKKIGRRVPVSAQASIIAALEAWSGAFGQTTPENLDKISLIVAGNNINQGYQHRMRGKFADQLVPASYALHYLDTDQVGLISEILGIRGEGFTVGGASASGNVGLLQGYRQIKFGLSEVCLVIGAMADLSPVELQAFEHTGALGGKRFARDPELACRPFDADREGFIYGQGSACLILESPKSAQARGAAIWGQIAGGAQCLDANRLTDPSASGEARVMLEALKDAGCLPEEVGYVNAHATSSRLGDAIEVEALKNLFGPHLGSVRINGTKSFTGHCLYAASIIEAVATLIQMKERFLHPNLNLVHAIDSDCNFAGLTSESLTFELALSNAFAFGGINSSIIFKRF